MMITKSSGEQMPLDLSRVEASMRRVGATAADVAGVVRDVQRTAHAGMTTNDVYRVVATSLGSRAPAVLCRYRLRDGLLALGPAGFYFEQYIAAVFARSGYRTSLPEELQGSCVKHEVDVLAQKDDRTIGIEAKFRNVPGDIVRLKDVMATYARYLDLLDGAALQLCPKLHEFWIVTNGRFSERAERFGRCKGMKLLGWDYPTKTTGLASKIDRATLYPVTVLGISRSELAAFAEAGLLLCDDLTKHEAVDVAHRVGISQSRAEELIELSGDVCAVDG